MAINGRQLEPPRVAKQYIRRVRGVLNHLLLERGMVEGMQVW